MSNGQVDQLKRQLHGAQAEIERLKAALQQIAHDKTEIGYAQHIARAALEGKPTDPA